MEIQKCSFRLRLELNGADYPPLPLPARFSLRNPTFSFKKYTHFHHWNNPTSNQPIAFIGCCVIEFASIVDNIIVENTITCIKFLSRRPSHPRSRLRGGANNCAAGSAAGVASHGRHKSYRWGRWWSLRPQRLSILLRPSFLPFLGSPSTALSPAHIYHHILYTSLPTAFSGSTSVAIMPTSSSRYLKPQPSAPTSNTILASG